MCNTFLGLNENNNLNSGKQKRREREREKKTLIGDTPQIVNPEGDTDEEITRRRY